MATTPYILSADWESANRHTASGDTDIILSNTGARTVSWTLTNTDLAPGHAVKQGHPLLPYQSRAMTLTNGERIWFAGEGATVSLGI